MYFTVGDSCPYRTPGAATSAQLEKYPFKENSPGGWFWDVSHGAHDLQRAALPVNLENVPGRGWEAALAVREGFSLSESRAVLSALAARSAAGTAAGWPAVGPAR